jgi:hypothetical protein
VKGGPRNETPHLTANLSLCHSATPPQGWPRLLWYFVSASPEGLALTKIQHYLCRFHRKSLLDNRLAIRDRADHVFNLLDFSPDEQHIGHLEMMGLRARGFDDQVARTQAENPMTEQIAALPFQR